MADIFFLIKKTVSFIFLPLPFISILIVIGLVLLWTTRRQTPGKIFVTLGMCLLLLTSFGFLSDHLLMSLENRYPPLLDVKSMKGTGDIKWIVVLGGGNVPDPRRPLSSQIAPASLTRLVEGIRLHRQLPGSKLLLSGGATSSQTPEAETLAKTALLMGIKEKDIICENKSLDTVSQAKTISGIIGRSKFILVTSAFHMPRSMALFHKYGMDPIPAPTGYIVHRQPHFDPVTIFPDAGSLGKMEIAIHEYLGMVWAHVQ